MPAPSPHTSPSPASDTARHHPYRLIAWGACHAFLAIGAGAFAAHGLKHHLDEYHLDIFHTAADYQLAHALALLALGLLAQTGTDITLHRIARLMQTGIFLFSGSLYLLALGRMPWPGMITPLGGLCFLGAWAWLAIHAFRRSNDR